MQELSAQHEILSWNEFEDYPHYDEFIDLGSELSIDEYEVLEEAKNGIPAGGDKLFGWPYWVPSVDYPIDRTTKSPMQLHFQIDSEDNLPYMFGDSFAGHITQRIDNANELTFAWNCG